MYYQLKLSVGIESFGSVSLGYSSHKVDMNFPIILATMLFDDI